MRASRRTSSGSVAGVALTVALAVAGVVAAPVAAQTVQKCVGADGHVTLTSGSCEAGQRLAARYDAVPEPVATGRVAEAGNGHEAGSPRAAGRAKAGPTRAARGRRASTSRARPGPDRCQAARDKRERTLQRVGLKRDFDLLRKLDDDVWNACR